MNNEDDEEVNIIDRNEHTHKHKQTQTEYNLPWINKSVCGRQNVGKENEMLTNDFGKKIFSTFSTILYYD